MEVKGNCVLVSFGRMGITLALYASLSNTLSISLDHCVAFGAEIVLVRTNTFVRKWYEEFLHNSGKCRSNIG